MTKSLPAAEGDQLDLARHRRPGISRPRRPRQRPPPGHGSSSRRSTVSPRIRRSKPSMARACMHLDERDRARVKAFMRGLNRTAPLAFGHPGLGTTAVRANGRLTIQNDIGHDGCACAGRPCRGQGGDRSPTPTFIGRGPSSLFLFSRAKASRGVLLPSRARRDSRKTSSIF